MENPYLPPTLEVINKPPPLQSAIEYKWICTTTLIINNPYVE